MVRDYKAPSLYIIHILHTVLTPVPGLHPTVAHMPACARVESEKPRLNPQGACLK